MSGQPYRYFNDPTKYRTQYMDTLGLQADIDSMNYDANKTYKETGQLPAVSQLKDTRSTSEILLDYEKLKLDIIKTVATISSPNFGQMVVQSIINNPLNSDNKLLTFTAQRIVDIVASVKKLYRYGIKGDSNDAEQFVDFVTTMFNDKNAMTAQTKSFMNRMGIKTLAGTPANFSQIYENLNRLGASILNYRDDILGAGFGKFGNENFGIITTLIEKAEAKCGDIVDYIQLVLKIIPKNPFAISAMEKHILAIEEQQYPLPIDDEFSDYTSEYEPRKKGEETKSSGKTSIKPPSSEHEDYDYQSSITSKGSLEERKLNKNVRAFMFEYLDFLNMGLPNTSSLFSSMELLRKQLSTNYLDSKLALDAELEASYYTSKTKHRVKMPDQFINYQGTLNAIISVNQTLDNMENILRPNWGTWSYRDLEKLHATYVKMMKQHAKEFNEQPEQMAPPINVNISNFPKTYSLITNPELTEENIQKQNDRQAIKDIEKIILDKNDKGESTEEDEATYEGLLATYKEKYGEDYEHSSSSSSSSSSTSGSGIKKRRGRPMGRGIAKPISYKESVKAHAVLDKGIMETPRFLKFGKYLVNNHKLHNEDIFALKRPSGGNIVEIPSIKVSKNLGGVIKKMLGGAIPTYSDISKLSEPEKAYLHKVSQKSNILDKFDIPAPAKDNQDKDVHQFEVMRGEIMAGNDSKELIKKFKLHILKLSRNGTLPKREVQEILEELVELGN